MSFSQQFALSDTQPKSSALSTALKVLGLVGVTAATGYLVVSQWETVSKSLMGEEKDLSPEELLTIMKELSKEFHFVLTDVAQAVVRVRTALRDRGLTEQLTPEQLRNVMVQQCNVQGKLAEVEYKVLDRFGVKDVQVEKAEAKYVAEGHKEVKKFSEGFSTMFDTALAGKLPTLPGYELPPEVTPDVLLEVTQEILTEKLNRFAATFKDFWAKNPDGAADANGNALSSPPPELGNSLQEANDGAERDVLKGKSDLVGDRASFYSALAICSRDPSFMKERQRQEKMHQVELVRVINNPQTTGKPDTSLPAPPLVHELNDALEPIAENDLPIRLVSAQDTNTPVIVSLVRPPNKTNPTVEDLEANLTVLSTKLKTISEAIPSLKDKRDATFFYMWAEKDSKLIKSDKTADLDVVHVLFSSPRTHQVPIACLSVEELAAAWGNDDVFTPEGLNRLQQAGSVDARSAPEDTTAG